MAIQYGHSQMTTADLGSGEHDEHSQTHSVPISRCLRVNMSDSTLSFASAMDSVACLLRAGYEAC